MSIHRSLLLLSLFVLTAGEATPQISADYYPLRVGNTWIYRQEPDAGVAREETMRVVDTVSIGGHLYFGLTGGTKLLLGATDMVWVRKISAFSSLLNFVQDRVLRRVGDVEYLWYDFTLETMGWSIPLPGVAETWEWSYTYEGERALAVPAGSFEHCVGFRAEPTQPLCPECVRWEWFAPSVGPVEVRPGWILREAHIGGVLYPPGPPTGTGASSWGRIKSKRARVPEEGR